MTDKEFKRFNRMPQIDVIYPFRLEITNRNAQNRTLEGKLTDRLLRADKNGDVAENTTFNAKITRNNYDSIIQRSYSDNG